MQESNADSHHQSDSDNNQIASDRRARPRRISPSAVIWGGLLGIGMVAVALCVYWVATSPARIPDLTEAIYDGALERWKTKGPWDYELDVVLSGNQTGNIHVEVRDGQVVNMIRNGITPKRQLSWEYWTVDGQFDTIGQEIEMAKDLDKGFPAPRGSQVVQRARFDRELGYPLEYQRMVLGAQLEIHWKVTNFKSLAAATKADSAQQ